MAQLLTYKQMGDLLKNNLCFRDKLMATTLLRQLLSVPRELENRGLVICGPEGIGKTEGAEDELGDYDDKIKSTWATLSDGMKRSRRWIRRTDDTDPNALVYRPTWQKLNVSSTPPAFIADLEAYCGQREGIFGNDFRSLEEKKIRDCLHAALESDGLVRAKTFFNLNREDINYRGMVLLLENRKRYETWQGKQSLYDLFGGPLFDRFQVHEICFDPVQVFRYIFATAFVHDKEEGLWKYLLMPSDETYPDDHPNVELRGHPVPERYQGLGFTGSDELALEYLTDVMDEFLAWWESFRNLSYRALRRRLRRRVFATNKQVWADSLFIELRTANVASERR